jgi:prepilin-type processing-associated H-X9-DG protein
MTSDRRFEKLDSDVVYEGRIFSVEKDRYRFEDGDEVDRDIIRHPGAAGIVAFGDGHVWLVRQPREAADDPDMLEIPAGILDEEGESPLDAAKRELAEEIGQGAETWEHLTTFFSSVGVMDEQVHLYLATDLHEREVEGPEHDERIEVVRWPLDRLDEAIAQTRDSKTLIGLLMLHCRLRERGA